MKHLLLKLRFVLCFEQDKKRFFSKWAKPEEKAVFKLKQKALKEERDLYAK